MHFYCAIYVALNTLALKNSGNFMEIISLRAMGSGLGFQSVESGEHLGEPSYTLIRHTRRLKTDCESFEALVESRDDTNIEHPCLATTSSIP